MMRGCVVWLATCALAAGCDYFLRIDHIGPLDGGVSPADSSVPSDGRVACTAAILHDPFDGPAFCAPWGTSYADLGATIKEDGTLVLTPNTQVDSIAGCLTSGSSQMFGTGVTARVIDIARDSGAYTVLLIHGPEVQIKATGNGVVRFETSAGMVLGSPFTFTSPQLWRIRPTATSIVGEVSSDGKQWTMIGLSPQTPPPTIGIEIAAGTTSVSVSGAGIFDELAICAID